MKRFTVVLFFLAAVVTTSCKSTNLSPGASGSLKADGIPGSDGPSGKKKQNFDRLITSIKNALPPPPNTLRLGQCTVQFIEVQNPEADDEWYSVYKTVRITFDVQKDQGRFVQVNLNGGEFMKEGGIFSPNGEVIVGNGWPPLNGDRKLKVTFQFESPHYREIKNIKAEGWYWNTYYKADGTGGYDWSAEINDKCVR